MKYSKWKSRTFWFSVVWSAFIPLAIVMQVFVPSVEIPIEVLIPWAGGITVSYVGGEKVRDSMRDKGK